MKKFSDKQIIQAWFKNVNPWIQAIDANEIASRVKVTNQAIIDTVLAQHPKKVLDIGCGEGWLVRALTEQGIDTLGVDVVPAFIEHAKQKPGRYQCISYEDLSYSCLNECFDVLVCNFSLLGKESVEHVVKQSRGLLNKGGVLIVQTLHPDTVAEADAKDGWHEGAWQGFSEPLSAQFSDPAPWYFRTLLSWQQLFADAGFNAVEVLEPSYPVSMNEVTQAVSLILLGRLE